MKVPTIATGLILVAGVMLAQQKLPTVNTETPEGQLLQAIGLEEDTAKKLPLLEKFTAEHAKHEAIGWVYSQLQQGYLKANQPDKSLEAGEKLAALDPNDLECVHNNLKAAEARKDPDQVRKWSALTSALCQKVAASPKPSEEDEVEAWKSRVDFAKQLDKYTEYSLYAVALQTADTGKRIELSEALWQRNPKSEYMVKLAQLEFDAYRQAKDTEKALATCERVFTVDQSNEDMLIFAADEWAKKKDQDKVIAYSTKVVEVLATKPKPEGVSDADWANKKSMLSGLANLLAGSTYLDQKKLKEADAALRAGLPQVAANEQLKAAILFNLGIANHRLKNMADAIKFTEQCAAIKGPYQAKASQNLKAMRGQ